MSAEINFNVAHSHIQHGLSNIAKLEQKCTSPVDWSNDVIQLFTDMWDMNEVDKYKAYSQRLASMFNEFIFDVQKKMDDLAKIDYSLGLTSVIFFALNLHAKIHGAITDKTGERLSELFQLQLSSVLVSESLQASAFTAEDIMIDAFNRETKHRRLQLPCLQLIRTMAIDQELERLAFVVGAHKSKKSNVGGWHPGEKRFSMGVLKKEGPSRVVPSSSSNQFTFGEKPHSKAQTPGTPDFQAVKRKAETERRFEIGNSEKNLEFLKGLFQQKISKGNHIPTEMDTEAPQHPVMQTFSDQNKPYVKFEPSEGLQYERLLLNKKRDSSRNSANSIDQGPRRSLASSSYRFRDKILHQSNDQPQTSKYLLNIINCPDEEYFEAKYKKRCGIDLNSAEKERLQKKYRTSPTHKRSSSVDSSYCKSESAVGYASRDQSNDKQIAPISRSQTPPVKSMDLLQDMNDADRYQLAISQWEDGIIALATPPSEYA